MNLYGIKRKGYIVLKKTVTKSMCMLLLELNIHIPCDTAVPLLGKYPMQEYMYKNVHNSPKPETIQTSISNKIDKSIRVYSDKKKNELLIK